MSSFDLISVGNAIIDAHLVLNKDHNHVRVDEKTHELCFPMGGKVKVDSAQFLLGGNAANVSVGIARQGLSAAITAEIGDDEFSEKIVNTLQGEKVDITLVKRSQAGSSFAVGINVGEDRTLFVEHVKRAHNFTFENMSSKWLYLTSIGDEWKTAYRNTLGFIDSSHAKLAFNPGTYQLSMLGQEIFPILSRCEVLFVNKEEAATISNFKLPVTHEEKENEKIIIDLLQILTDHGVKVVVITDGKNGAYAMTQQHIYHTGQFPAQIVERTGAGDAFSSGFLGAIIAGKDHKDAMKWGSCNAASVIEHVGAQAGLLHRKEIEKRLSEHPEFEATQIN